MTSFSTPRSPLPSDHRQDELTDSDEERELDMGDYGTHEDDDDFHQPTLETPLPASNKGYMLLMKMGWTHGTGLGKSGEGRVDPVPISFKEDTMGVGKNEELNAYHDVVGSKRKALESELIAEETEEERILREGKVQKVELIKEEIKAVTAAFYCALCDKQYTKISEYEAHLSSYDHHHRKRFKEMQDMTKRGTLPGTNKRSKREDKERAREMKEMERIQAAALARLSKDSKSAAEAPATTPQSLDDEISSTSGDGGGWGAVSDLSAPSTASGISTGGFLPVSQPVGSSADSAQATGNLDVLLQQSAGAEDQAKSAEKPPAKLSFGLQAGKKAPVKFSFGAKKK
ncbi:hypothetical protein HK104_009612 [Borealophlyctis nickersoniae]|nr:hypothetical protein HK104_009612 [Borealophlyctis nickersoniae]